MDNVGSARSFSRQVTFFWRTWWRTKRLSDRIAGLLTAYGSFLSTWELGATRLASNVVDLTNFVELISMRCMSGVYEIMTLCNVARENARRTNDLVFERELVYCNEWHFGTRFSRNVEFERK
jgi:hypothetical protein